MAGASVETIRQALRDGDIQRSEAERLLRLRGISPAQVSSILASAVPGGAREALAGDFATAIALGIGQAATQGAGDPVDVGGDPFDTDPIFNPDPEPLPPPVIPPPVVAPPPVEPPGTVVLPPPGQAPPPPPTPPGFPGPPPLPVAPPPAFPPGQGPGEGIQPPPLPPVVNPDPSTAPPNLTPLQLLQIEESATRGGRNRLFDQFMASQPLMSALAQRSLQGRFNPLSARFNLMNLAQSGQGQSGLNFLSFLGNRADIPVSGQGFLGALQGLSGIFGSGANEFQQTQAASLADPSNDAAIRNIIAQGFASQFAPALRGGAARVAQRNIGQFEGANEGNIPLFQAFLQGLLGQGQGPFFGGF